MLCSLNQYSIDRFIAVEKSCGVGINLFYRYRYTPTAPKH